MPGSLPSDLELMSRHVRAGYVHDGRGDLVRINDWSGRAAPLFWLGRTKLGVIWRFRADVPAGVRAEVGRLSAAEPPCGDTASLPKHHVSYRQLLAPDDAAAEIVAGPTYWLARPIASCGDVVLVTPANQHLLNGGLEAWIPDVLHQQPFVVSVVAGRAVSVCASVRITAEAHAAGVETLPGHRRRGHAAAAVAGWAREVTRQRRNALYSTSWGNLASQGVASRLGLERFGDEYRVG